MRIHIVNDGKRAYMSKVIDADTGQELPMVKRVVIDFDVDRPEAQALLYQVDGSPLGVSPLPLPQVDVIAEVSETRRVCPWCEQERTS